MMDAGTKRALRLYRALLRMLPADFRDKWGADAEELIEYRLSTADGTVGRVWIWARAIWDVLAHGTVERLRRLEARRGGGMGSTLQDIRYAARGLWSSKALSAIAIVTLALGIGASTATFSVVNAVLFRDLPYEEPDRLVVIWPDVNFNKALALEAATLPALEQVSGVSNWSLTLTGEGDPLELTGTLVSPNHFRLLGRTAHLGRTFHDEEALPGQADVVVLGYGLWVRAFGADPAVLGRTIGLAGAEYERRTIVGVMPESFRPVFEDTDLWIPLEHDPALGAEEDGSWYVNYRIARLAPGATLQQANQQVARFGTDVRRRLPSIYDEEDARTAGVESLSSFTTEGFDEALLAALAAVALVLLIACANVANLLLVRGESRSRDLAVRSAFGAGRLRVARMLLAEGGILGFIGGASGVALSYALVSLLLSRAPADFPRIAEVSIDGSVLGFALFTTLAATLVAGFVPAVRASRVNGAPSLTSSARGTAAHSDSNLSRSLVGLEVALAVVVTVGSGLMLRSFDRLMSVDTGLDASGVLTFRANPPAGRYPDGDAFHAYYDLLQQSLDALPGVASTGGINLLPGTTGTWSFPTHPEGVEVPEGSAVPSTNFRAVRPGYFESVRMPLVSGRRLADFDVADADNVVVVNEAFVAEFWPGLDPLGRTVRLFSRTATPSRVVGVVGDVRQHGRARAARSEMYFPHSQVPWQQMAMWMMVRFVDDDPLAHADAVREAVWSIDPDVPITGLEELDSVFGRSAETTAFLTFLLTSFGGLALLLGAVGVFGVTSYLVERRAPEFGVRIALGSSRTQVLASGLSKILIPVAIGLALGLAGARATTGALESVLYDVEATDPTTFVVVGLLFAAAALLAALVPAWRASRVDPVTVLNRE